MSIVRFKRITSTSDKAKLLASSGAAEWTTVVAEVQTGGRGRAGKKWESRKGGLWFSVILRPRIPPGKVSLLQFLASNATRRALSEETGVRACTKWPNDLVVRTGKLAGILVESQSKGDSVSFVVVGIGINVNQESGELPAGATSVYAANHHKSSLEALMNGIIENMKLEFRELDNPGKILDEWWTSCIHRPVQVQVQTISRTVKGVSTGIDLDGSLLVQTAEGLERVVDGTLRLNGSADNDERAGN
jgi:BirA family transcriptional regulator, biotin operon repressor / biotin---[acetyl-CoA-carboxylase] ligase